MPYAVVYYGVAFMQACAKTENSASKRFYDKNRIKTDPEVSKPKRSVFEPNRQNLNAFQILHQINKTFI